ncbi:hypothetical protein J2T41_004495 [Pseudomonas citronellolis]|uniref:hypothetical protein n=1 Tax=Pseudomonas citronellolis TaxID=53408 RepID=UPI00209D0AF2|nr:hypothetical protein [Pseudomonas citronellolis]MCP1644856.1 hypothetical protein [Pseudomonas citronellolis]MCP1667801.1 hypothetical protein [Pseudomonas citronellolis]MCP1699103.1 hypothetical protein [Pseudomonas citronellolis]MCP1704908.1 hypothetical protein [Pseudomonas citronellolis]MCP1799666.1 hypothetical protein [Pseudomonas citronellolis]
MQKTTVILDQYGQPIVQQSRLVVAALDVHGNIDSSTIQFKSEWDNGLRSLDLVVATSGADLLQLLTYELGLVSVNEQGLLQHHIVFTPDVHVTVMRVLGRIAEALIVRECNRNPTANRRWAMYARRGKIPHRGLDNYKAVGTGLHTTERLYPTKYRPSDTQRDIIWVHVEDLVSELIEKRQIGASAGVPGGLQIKVSQDGFRYIYRSDVRRGRYEIPLVYFDLANDYYKLTNAIYQEERDNVRIGVDILRGRDISPEIHEWLQSYYDVVYNLVTGRLTLDALIRDELLLDAFKKDVQEHTLGGDLIVV